MFTFAQRRKKGFTLIELLIVIVVIAILALIVIPRLMNASRKAKEATLVANLQQIRSGVETFHAETGYFPATLLNLTEDTVTVGMMIGAPTNLNCDQFKGPYLFVDGTKTNLPNNPFAVPPTTDDATTSTGINSQWTYTATGTTPPIGTVKPVSGTIYPDAGVLLDKRIIADL